LLGWDLYNQARAEAARGKAGEAIGSLAQALDAGFLPFDLLETDEQLDSLRSSFRFEELRRQTAHQVWALALAGNRPFPFDFTLEGLDGKPVALADRKGKVTIVSFWGTWCAPCRKLIPHFIKLYQQDHQKGLEIVGVNYEDVPAERAQPTVQAYVDRNRIPYPCALGNVRTEARVPGFRGYPTTLFLDRSGTVRLKVVGYLLWHDLETVVTMLLAEDEPGPVGPR
jgi:thiol-disulfide isomerase/thioredoxin